MRVWPEGLVARRMHRFRLRRTSAEAVLKPSGARSRRGQAARADHGIALLIVISLLTVVGVIGVAFAFSMYLETQATRQFVSTTQARYVAEAGVSYARALLDEDALGSRVDDLAETWLTAHQGGDVDVDDDGELDAQWQLVTDSRQETVGRYAVKVTDESGKVNLNAAQARPAAAPSISGLR